MDYDVFISFPLTEHKSSFKETINTKDFYIAKKIHSVLQNLLRVNTFFSDLNKLKPGDEIKIYTTYGCFTYRVTEQITFKESDKRYIAVTEEEILTLYTCQPQVLGSSDLRVGVRCALVSKEFKFPEE